MGNWTCQVADVSLGGLLCLNCVACVFEVDGYGRHGPDIPGKLTFVNNQQISTTTTIRRKETTRLPSQLIG